MTEGKLGRLVRYAVYFSALLTLSTVVGLYVMRVAFEDRRPMILRIESTLAKESEYRVYATFATKQAGKRYPQVRFDGLGTCGTCRVPAGEVKDLKVGLDVPGGFMSIFKNEIATGDLKSKIHIEPMPPTPQSSDQNELPGKSFDLEVHIASALETWWPTVIALAVALAVFAVLYFLSRVVLVSPTGRLVVLDRESGEEIRAVGGAPIEYDLTDRRLHWRKLFWMRDLIQVSTGWPRNLVIELPGGSRVEPFVLQFASVGPLLSCPRGQLQVYESETSNTLIHVADAARIADWRKRLRKTAEEQAESQSVEETQEHEYETPAGGSLCFADSEPSETTETVDVENELIDCVLLDHGARIVSGDFLITYRTTT